MLNLYVSCTFEELKQLDKAVKERLPEILTEGGLKSLGNAYISNSMRYPQNAIDILNSYKVNTKKFHFTVFAGKLSVLLFADISTHQAG